MGKEILLTVIIAASALRAAAQQPLTPEKEVWSPEPFVVTPAQSVGDIPSDAILLFDGKNLDEWESAIDSSKPAQWMVDKGILTVVKKAGTIQTKKKFTDYQLHVEWRIPANITGEGQSRGNSGVMLASTGSGDRGFELQVLDSYQSKTYVNGQAGAVYNQYAPMVNACKKPGEWQSYDIIWTAARFNADSSLNTPARVTAFHNGILIQNNVALRGPTAYYPDGPAYKNCGATSIKLQAHGDPGAAVSYRNIWVRKI